jgi:Cysteine sulfinate desulfinase/cysteine desulfurase and related enzymes
MEHYLDNAATTKVCPEAAEAALKAMTELYGNPSSTHTKGREARKLLDESRKKIAKTVGCAPDEVVFTSCGSESDNWALISGAEAMKRNGKHIISSAVEHDAIRKTLDKLEAQGYEITRLMPDGTGAISVESVKDALRDDTILVSLMMVNNETGAVTDIHGISEMLKSAGSKALLHTDAVQAFMKVPFSAKKLGADMISMSGHKIHAPKGIGLLYIRNGIKLKPFIVGGEQENGHGLLHDASCAVLLYQVF